jgi:hypothetical protein
MTNEQLHRSGLLDLHIADSIAIGILASRISITASNRKRMMPNRGLIWSGNVSPRT